MLALATDHIPIVISIEKPPNFISVDNRNFIKFHKGNWDGFTAFTETTLTALPIPTHVVVDERQFRKIMEAVAARFTSAWKN